MAASNRFLSADSAVFWIFFIMSGVFVYLQLPEVALGLFVVMLGVHRIGSEVRNRQLSMEREELQDTLASIREWLERNYDYTQDLRDKYDTRFFNVDRRNLEKDRKIEKQHREIVGKMLAIDNKLMEVSRAFLTKAPRSGRGKKK